MKIKGNTHQFKPTPYKWQLSLMCACVVALIHSLSHTHTHNTHNTHTKIHTHAHTQRRGWSPLNASCKHFFFFFFEMVVACVLAEAGSRRDNVCLKHRPFGIDMWPMTPYVKPVRWTCAAAAAASASWTHWGWGVGGAVPSEKQHSDSPRHELN